MKQVTVLAALFTLTVLGCGHKDVYVAPDGSSAVVNKDANGTTQVNVTDKSGNSVSETMGKDGVSMTNSKGESMTMSAGAVTEDILGLPFYPGSQESKNGMTMVTDTADQKGAMSTRTTPDDPDKVTAFYKDKITSSSSTSSTTNDTKVSTVSGKLANGADVSVVATKEGGNDTTVLVTMGLKKTK